MTENRDIQKGIALEYIKVLSVNIANTKRAKQNASNTYQRGLSYTKNFYKSHGKTNNRIQTWINSMNNWLTEKYSCYTHGS